MVKKTDRRCNNIIRNDITTGQVAPVQPQGGMIWN